MTSCQSLLLLSPGLSHLVLEGTCSVLKILLLHGGESAEHDKLENEVGEVDGWFVGGHFPAFNLADSAITLGAVLMIIDELRRARHNGSHTQT